MIIRKLYRFEAAHIVRNCSSDRCKYSLHGHSFRCELELSAERLDRGQMVYDFGLLKRHVRDFLDGFDHATLFWERESADFRRSIERHSRRWIRLPVSPTAEQLSRVIFVGARALLAASERANGDEAARVHSVTLHETETGCAQSFEADADSLEMGRIDLARVVFSPTVMADWSDPKMWEKLLKGARFKTPATAMQIPARRA
ncbi:MAG: 6-carboxytetrahydropterin synthase [Elusimicrobia bacterium]|nr:6-carboxytetrahydropterin synthase [Elusimicrobiota bacterium]